jgi:hypothetical protein
MALSISRCIISSLLRGRFSLTSCSHSSKNATSLLLPASSGKFDSWKNSMMASRPDSISRMASANLLSFNRSDAFARVFIIST